MVYIKIIYFVLLLLQSSYCQLSENYSLQNPCITKSTCHECIQTSSCAWCFQPDFENKRRCFLPSPTEPNGGCKEEFVYNPGNIVSTMEDRFLSKGTQYVEGGIYEQEYNFHQMSSHSESGVYSESVSHSTSAENQVVQIKPQRVKLTMRINQAERIAVSYAQAEDYPVDLYYLMDLSYSMKNDKDKLVALGDMLSDTMKNITTNFRLGFGSFVDKVVTPYVSTVPKSLISPCEECEAPYGYINSMSLSRDTFLFKEAVKRAKVSGNLDGPEGGFDAMMQAIVCRQEIGWREKARRLLVFSTDAGFHYAGDGKLGGIVRPNDGLCHLENKIYTHSSIQDYPSISQINYEVKKNSINVIFAVTSDQIEIYEKLKDKIEGATTGILTSDSSNVVDLVKEQYEKISSSVEMKDNSTSDIQVTYYSSCLNGGDAIETNKCDGIKVGNKVEFQAEITVTRCPEDPAKWNQIFKIYPVGINESLIVDLTMLCQCPCAELDQNIDKSQQSVKCSDFGDYECGICKCNPGRYGSRCECGTTGEVQVGTESCKASPDAPDCSNRGACVCGKCECHKRADPTEEITGPFCECDNFSCDRNNGSLCSGPDHGTCNCGRCVCLPGWTGPACDCRTTIETCIAPESTKICSDHGHCECGICVCDDADENTKYSGRYCDKCPTCPGRCDEYRDCVECQMYQTGVLAEDCQKNCTTFVPIGVPELIQNDENDEHFCTFYDANDCLFAYIYSYDEHNKVVIRAKQEKSCPSTVTVPAVIFGVIGAIVLIGLALLMLWKMVTTIHDRREFARFEKERMKAKWDTGENPIYKQATTTFKNPTYSGK